MYQKILITIADSDESELVLAAGLTLAEKFESQVLLLHVINPSLPSGFSPLVGGMFPIVNDLAIEQYAKEWKEYESNGIERLQACAQQARSRGIEAEVSQNFGDAGRIICEVAKSWSADSIVMGRRDRQSILSEILVGSTSNYVLHHAPCSTIVIQPPASSQHP
ncbi:universal stress protein [Chamaesiphon minutus]|uniref:Universal stress protein UspA-like protein n=1 Tax=Chamaesiphon minutus (strain ATCC 27169 / PCC 6605) TaxID=1173020 RepID=K9URB0_CHAP6|nr:universal stress protein [Chamaesiphon minutus]AFY96774.1 universal stress protein UspA-like protein [Chamaesiphon minutus PCC 6605]